MFLQSCPSESDPRVKVAGFVSDRSVGSIGGLRTDGMQFLIDLVTEEIRRQEPDSRLVILDRDFLSDNGVDFARDLDRVMDRMTLEGARVNWIVEQDVPVIDWQKALEKLRGRDTQVYMFTNACRQVPCCFRLLGNQRERGAGPRFQDRSWNSPRIASSMSWKVVFSGTMSGGNPNSSSLLDVGRPIAAILTL